jgi:hypothetical protein
MQIITKDEQYRCRRGVRGERGREVVGSVKGCTEKDCERDLDSEGGGTCE